MSVLQICLLSLIGILAVASIVFTAMFVVEISVKEKNKVKKIKIKKVIKQNEEKENEELQISVDEMLENLEKQVMAEENQTQVQKNEVVTENAEEEIQEISIEEQIVEVVDEVKNSEEEVAEQPKEEIIEEKVEIDNSEDVVIEKEDVKEEQTEEIKIEDVAEVVSEDESDDDEDEEGELAYEILEPEIVLAPGTVIDYKARLEKVVASKTKIEKDLAKIQKFILKYERTDRRKARNQKMLDRRAGELTNLNLVMYSVTDIKNVDEDKKVKQEELTSHIAELKASIQDAEEYLESNKEKYAHNVKMAKFLSQERIRFAEEIAELKALINAADENK